MKYVLIFFIILSLFAIHIFGQATQKSKAADPPKAVDAASDAAALELAKSTLAAHGGDKLKALKTLIVRGSVDVTTSAIAQAIPATFVMVFAGEKYRFELVNPFQPIKQIFDGTNTSSNIQNGFTLPPINRLGFPLLARIGDTGFKVAGLPESSKKKNGFRITAPDGFFTDYYIDEKTKQVKGYESAYELNGRSITTSAEIDKYKIVDGISIPEKYSQRFDLGQITAFADFKAKEILVNTAVADDVFSIGN